ncbi:MAG TPA: hypothetical protein ENJ41_03555 [Oceanospirillales bacterium]|nr:hypothetical protein [Oceanospirillales bacterium]
MNEIIILLVLLILSSGVLIYFIGAINSLIIALGNKHYVFALAILLFNPIAIVYCLINWEIAETQGKQLVIGLIISGSALVPCYIYYSKFYALIS